MPQITILIVNYNTAKFIRLSLYALQKLTSNDYVVYIIDNNSAIQDYELLKEIASEYDNVQIWRNKTKLVGSIAHGTALNELVKKVKTPYTSILDADATWLKKNWDEILISQIDEQLKIIGSEAPYFPPYKPKDFPLMFAILFETATFNNLNIDFRPLDITKATDTGWELREKYLAANYTGKNLELPKNKTFQNESFKELLVEEYYLDGNFAEIFASHFGRGSLLGKTRNSKYNKGLNKLKYRIPFLGRKLLRKKGIEVQNEWLRVCKIIVDEQLKDVKDLETVSCDYCGAKDYSAVLKGKDWHNGVDGIYSVVKCNNCELVFTNPRPTKEAIHKFYPDEANYYQPQVLNLTNFREKLKHSVLQEYLDYPKEGKSSFLKKIILFPLYLYLSNILKTHSIPPYKTNGTLLDIGCSYGNYLRQMKHYGWKVKGLEMNEKAANFGIQEFGLDIELGDLDSFQTDQKFDVIVLNMVLEHVLSPKETLKQVNHLLKKNGTLIISIPNFDGYEAQKYKEYAYTLQIPTHITHFTPKTVRRYLDEAKFENIKIHFHQTTTDLVDSLEYMEADNHDIGLKKVMRIPFIRKTLVKIFINTLAVFGKTSRMTIWSKKK